MDQEIVDLTNKLLDAKNTIDRMEELNVSPTPTLTSLADLQQLTAPHASTLPTSLANQQQSGEGHTSENIHVHSLHIGR